MEQDELPVKKSVDNAFRGEMSERICHARTMTERKETRTLREKRESRRTNRSKKTNAPKRCVCLFGAGDESPCFSYGKSPPSQLQIARLILLKTIINRFLYAKSPLGVRLSLII